mmetsp:Transcript_40246/g.79366  ORF Transcript_40246/g.79366 Transcript_40246/m.79366 type:complete len:104 (-) Transcript_40246:504-815(-)
MIQPRPPIDFPSCKPCTGSLYALQRDGKMFMMRTNQIIKPGDGRLRQHKTKTIIAKNQRNTRSIAPVGTSPSFPSFLPSFTTNGSSSKICPLHLEQKRRRIER